MKKIFGIVFIFLFFGFYSLNHSKAVESQYDNSLVRDEYGSYHYIIDDNGRKSIATNGIYSYPDTTNYTEAVINSNGMNILNATEVITQDILGIPIIGNLTIKAGGAYLLKLMSTGKHYIVVDESNIKEVNVSEYLNYSLTVIPEQFFGNYSVIKGDVVIQSKTISIPNINTDLHSSVIDFKTNFASQCKISYLDQASLQYAGLFSDDEYSYSIELKGLDSQKTYYYTISCNIDDEASPITSQQYSFTTEAYPYPDYTIKDIYLKDKGVNNQLDEYTNKSVVVVLNSTSDLYKQFAKIFVKITDLDTGDSYYTTSSGIDSNFINETEGSTDWLKYKTSGVYRLKAEINPSDIHHKVRELNYGNNSFEKTLSIPAIENKVVTSEESLGDDNSTVTDNKMELKEDIENIKTEETNNDVGQGINGENNDSSSRSNLREIIVKNYQMHSRLKGKIMLKIEDAGKAYYVNPKTETMHYLGRPNDAFTVMREQGIGITNKDLYKIPVGVSNGGVDTDGDGLSDSLETTLGLDPSKMDTDGDGYSDKSELENDYNPWGIGRQNIDNKFSGNQKGKILLQVEKKGEAWYVNPEDGKRYFLGRPADAFNVMRNLGLGISNNDFNLMIQ